MTLKQVIDIAIRINPPPFWANLSLYSYEEEYVSSLVSSNKMNARHFQSSKSFIDDLCAINDGVKLGRFICDIYLKKLGLKVEHHCCHVTFLNLDVTMKKGTFIYVI